MSEQVVKILQIAESDAGTVGEQSRTLVSIVDADGNPVEIGGGGESAPVAWGDVTGKPATFPPATHNHTVAQVTGLQSALDGKAPTSHTHAIANVTGLQAALDGKAATSHTHTVAQVTGLQAIIDDLTARIEALESA